MLLDDTYQNLAIILIENYFAKDFKAGLIVTK